VNELSDNIEEMLQKMTDHLAEISGKTFVAHDVVMKFRRSLLDHANQGD
jgi:hypothetical protein